MGFEPTIFGFREQRLNHYTTGTSWLRTNHTELFCINGIMWYKSLESINSTNLGLNISGSKKLMFQILYNFKNFKEILILNNENKIKMKIINN